MNLHCGIPGSATQVKMSSVKAYSRMLTHRYMCTHLRTGTHTHTQTNPPHTHMYTHTETLTPRELWHVYVKAFSLSLSLSVLLVSFTHTSMTCYCISELLVRRCLCSIAVMLLEVIETRTDTECSGTHAKDHGQTHSRDYAPWIMSRRPKGFLLIWPATRARPSPITSA